jgi:S-adenosylmethionine decarboxylase proenzyme
MVGDQFASAFPYEDREAEIGVRVLLDAYSCKPECCHSEQDLKALISKLAEAAGATIVNLMSHTFTGGALTIIAILSTSHCVVHTWPEHRFVSIDLFVCKSDIDNRALIKMASESLGASRVEAKEVVTKAAAR